jgi:tetratricopeptide (TPR) repeat protein
VSSDLTRAGNEEFETKLNAWASGLSLAATGAYLAAVLEAAGQSEPAVRILDRLARKEIYEERGTPDFQLLQLQYGRLGAAFGRFINVPDLNGMPSNASVETVQSLLRLQETEYAIGAMGWLPCLYLWLNQGATAISLAGEVMRGFYNNDWGPRVPQSEEEAVDAWIGATQACLLNTSSGMLEAIRATFDEAITRARRSGDVVRTARVLALYLVGMAETSKADVPALAGGYEVEFKDALRVGDSFAIGFANLAIGRWYTGPGGLALAQRIKDSKAVAQMALKYLDAAVANFDKQGMDPWVFFANLQQAKAWSDLGNIDAADEVIRQVGRDVDRFPVLASHLHETVGQLRLMTRHPEASLSFRAAIAAAEESGLYSRRDMLISHSSDQPGVMESGATPLRKRKKTAQKG